MIKQRNRNNDTEYKLRHYSNKQLNKLTTYYIKSKLIEKDFEVKNYIDPGIGTMLLSIFLTIFSCIVFTAQIIYLKLKKLFFKDGNNLDENTDIVIYSEGKQYWNVFENILDEFENRKIKIYFYTSDKDDFCFPKNYKYVETKYIGNINMAMMKLNCLKANICLMTTPNLNVFQLKKSKNVKKYVHIIHSIGSLLTYRLFGLDYYDEIICSSKYQKDEIQKLENIRNSNKKNFCIAGCSYLDNLNSKKGKINSDKEVIVIAPSWGPNSLLNKYGSKLIEKLKNIDCQVIIRPHPQSYISEKKLIEKLQNETKNTNIIWDNSSDNVNTLSKASILISDFSSIIWDFLFLYEKPFIYSIQNFNKNIYDAADIEQLPFDFQIFQEIGTELTEDNLINILTLIQNTKQSFNKEKLEYYKNIMWQNRNESYKKIADYLIDMNKELTKNHD